MSGSSETFDPSMEEILSSIRRIIFDEKKSSSSLSEDASKGGKYSGVERSSPGGGFWPGISGETGELPRGSAIPLVFGPSKNDCGIG